MPLQRLRRDNVCREARQTHLLAASRMERRSAALFPRKKSVALGTVKFGAVNVAIRWLALLIVTVATAHVGAHGTPALSVCTQLYV